MWNKFVNNVSSITNLFFFNKPLPVHASAFHKENMMICLTWTIFCSYLDQLWLWRNVITFVKSATMLGGLVFIS